MKRTTPLSAIDTKRWLQATRWMSKRDSISTSEGEVSGWDWLDQEACRTGHTVIHKSVRGRYYRAIFCKKTDGLLSEEEVRLLESVS